MPAIARCPDRTAKALDREIRGVLTAEPWRLARERVEEELRHEPQRAFFCLRSCGCTD
jgi:hypothetical protein